MGKNAKKRTHINIFRGFEMGPKRTIFGHKKFRFIVFFSRPYPLSGPILRDTARLSQRYPPIARCGVFGVSTWPIGCDTPSPFSERFPLNWRACEVEVRYPPLKRGISAILARYPMKTRQMGAIPPFAILSRKGIARYGGVSRTGPLSLPSGEF